MQRMNPGRTTRRRGASGEEGRVPRKGPAKVKPATAGDWVSGARLRTLPLAIAPVALGTGAAIVATGPGVCHPVRAVLALVVALCLQIGVNYANDYSDGIRGTDDHRVGPARLTGSGAATPAAVLSVALAFFGLAALAGLTLVMLTEQWWLLAVGAAAIAAAWFYTGGKRPVRLLRPRRALRLRLLRAGRHARHHLRAGGDGQHRELARAPSASA